jgi:ABC-2 type transport system ATP-binding protein
LDCFSDRAALKRHVGYLPDNPFFYDFLKGREVLRFVGDMHGVDRAHFHRRAERLFDVLGLSDVVDDYVTNYSLGMKKKMALATALIHEPSVLILDEPTTGLDPLASRRVRAFLREYADGGRTVLLSTHWLEMAESSCDRLAIMHRSRLVACGSPAELRNEFAQRTSLEDIFFQLTREREPVAQA